jgi:hypothetical protein
MSRAVAVTPAILDTILGRLALLFLSGAGGDLPTARHAASRMLAAYHAETPDELRLAAEIISFGLHALEALGQAAAEDLALSKVLRLRGSAVSLSRESHKAQRKLDQLQRDRDADVTEPAEAAIQAEPAMPPQQASALPAPVNQPPVPSPVPLAIPSGVPLARPRIEAAISLVESGRPETAPAGRNGGKTWTQAFQQRQTAKRIAENLKKNQAIHFATLNPANTTIGRPAQAPPTGQ